MNILDKVFKLEKEADEFGFSWENPEQILQQITSECNEVAEQLNNNHIPEKNTELQEEIGDLLHAVFSLCVFCGFDIKETINISLDKFAARMLMVRKIAAEKGIDNLQGHTFSELMQYWDAAKERLLLANDKEKHKNNNKKNINPDCDFADLVIYPLLDVDKALKSFNQDRSLVHDIFKSMVEHEIPQNLQIINKARENEDWDTITELVHKMKGGAMYCGTTKLQYACIYFEKYKKIKNLENLQEPLDKLLTICDETQDKIKGWLADKKEFFK